MSEATVEQVYELACQLSPEEQEALIRRLLRDVLGAKATEHPALGLLVFDVGAWPEHLTLRREEEYGDADR